MPSIHWCPTFGGLSRVFTLKTRTLRAQKPNPAQTRLFHALAALQSQIWAHLRVPGAVLAQERPSYDQTLAWFDQTIVWFDIWCAPAPPPSTEHVSKLNFSMVWTCPRPHTPAATPLDTTGHTLRPRLPSYMRTWPCAPHHPAYMLLSSILPSHSHIARIQGRDTGTVTSDTAGFFANT